MENKDENILESDDYKNTCEFLRAYRELCLKHNLQIGGCGCCHSPYVTGLSKGPAYDALSELEMYDDGVLVHDTEINGEFITVKYSEDITYTRVE